LKQGNNIVIALNLSFILSPQEGSGEPG